MSSSNVIIQQYRFLRGLVGKDRPIYLHVAVTHRCNLRCRMCAAWKLADLRSEASPTQFSEIARVFADLGCMQVSLGGGEPFMRKDLAEIVRAFNRNRIRVRVLTNGVAPTSAALEEVIQAGMTDVSISLDSLRPKLQAMIDGQPETLVKKFETIAYLLRNLPDRGSQPMLNAVVSRYNFGELPMLVDFAQRIGLTLSLIPIHSAKEFGDGDRFKTYAPDMLPRRGQQRMINRLYNYLRLQKRRRAPIMNSTSFLNLSEAYFLGRNNRFECDAGKLYFSVSPQGHISICHDFEGQQSIPLPELKRSLKASKFEADRRRLIRGCSGCIRPCWAETTYLIRDKRAIWEMMLTLVGSLGKRQTASYVDLESAAQQSRDLFRIY